MRHSFSHLAFLLVPGQTHPCGISLRLVASSLGVSWWHSRSGSWLGGERGQPQAHLAELWGGGGGCVLLFHPLCKEPGLLQATSSLMGEATENLQRPAGQRLQNHQCIMGR